MTNWISELFQFDYPYCGLHSAISMAVLADREIQLFSFLRNISGFIVLSGLLILCYPVTAQLPGKTDG